MRDTQPTEGTLRRYGHATCVNVANGNSYQPCIDIAAVAEERQRWRWIVGEGDGVASTHAARLFIGGTWRRREAAPRSSRERTTSSQYDIRARNGQRHTLARWFATVKKTGAVIIGVCLHMIDGDWRRQAPRRVTPRACVRAARCAASAVGVARRVS